MSLREVKFRVDVGPLHTAVKGSEAKLGQPGYTVGTTFGPESFGVCDIVVIAETPEKASVWEAGDHGATKLREVEGSQINSDPTTRKKLHYSS